MCEVFPKNFKNLCSSNIYMKNVSKLWTYYFLRKQQIQLYYRNLMKGTFSKASISHLALQQELSFLLPVTLFLVQMANLEFCRYSTSVHPNLLALILPVLHLVRPKKLAYSAITAFQSVWVKPNGNFFLRDFTIYQLAQQRQTFLSAWTKSNWRTYFKRFLKIFFHCIKIEVFH